MFSNLKKEEKWKKISSGRVHVWGSSLGDPWGSFAARPLTDSLELYRGDQTMGGTAGSQTAIFVLCGLFVTERAQDPAVLCLLKETWVKAQQNRASIHSESDTVSISHISSKRASNGQLLQGLAFPALKAELQAAFSHSLQWSNDSLPRCRRHRYWQSRQTKQTIKQKLSLCVFATKSFQDFGQHRRGLSRCLLWLLPGCTADFLKRKLGSFSLSTRTILEETAMVDCCLAGTLPGPP